MTPVVIDGSGHEPVSGLHARAPNEACLLVFGHGAGAPMTHPFMEELAAALAGEGISTLRYNFSYAERGRRRPDHLRRLLAVVASAVGKGRELADGAPLLAGGKSMGGRMTSMWAAAEVDRSGGGAGRTDNQADRAGGQAEPSAGQAEPGARQAEPGSGPTEPGASQAAPGNGPTGSAGGVKASDPPGAPAFPLDGIVFVGFPLHAPGRRGDERADHLAQVPCPMLFHQGTRDRLADLELLRPVVERLGPRARMHVVEGGDHSLAVLKRLGRTRNEVLAEVAAVTRRWADALPHRSP